MVEGLDLAFNGACGMVGDGKGARNVDVVDLEFADVKVKQLD